MIDPHAKMVDSLASAGHLSDAWRAAVGATPRKDFIPPIAWLGTDDGWQRLDKIADAYAWWAGTCADRSIVTQWDDGAVSLEDGPGTRPTSSISQPSIVADMLRETLIEDGNRVLEIGTGTGWNSALLTARLGGENVYTVEVDRQVATQARANLTRIARYPNVVTADGSNGYRPGAPYDRILSTTSVFSVPYPWVEQTRSGGYVVTPWRTALLNGLLLRLVVSDGGTASGRFVSTAAFMGIRTQRAPSTEVDITAGGEEGRTNTHPGLPLDGSHANAVIGFIVPRCYQWTEYGDDGFTCRIDDPSSDSWATVTVADDSAGPYPVRQGGPRRLWDEIVSAYARWQDIGKPELTRFGATVDQHGQSVWLDDPGNRIGPVP